MASITGGTPNSSLLSRLQRVVGAVAAAWSAPARAPGVAPERAAREVMGGALDRLGQLRRAAAGGQAPPSVPGAGWPVSLDPVLRTDQEQQKIWGSESAKYGRVTTSYGITPQAYSTATATDLTLERIAQIHHECDAQGFLHRKADLDFAVRRGDAHILSSHRERIAPTYRRRLEVAPADSSPLAWAVAAFVRQVFRQIPGFQKAEEDLSSAAAHGYSGLEVVWCPPRDMAVRVSKRRTVTVRNVRGVSSLEHVHPRDFRWRPIRRSMALDTGGGRFIDPFVNPDGTPTRKLIFHATEGQGDPHQRGYMFAGTPLALLKKQSWARWAVMLEYFGIATPYLLWDSSEVAEPEDIAAALSFLGNVGKGRPGFLPSKLGTLKLTETPTGIDARGQHAAMLGCVNGELSKLIKAQSLSAEAGGSGSYALATVQSDSKEEVQVIDAALASDTWTHQFVVFLVEENLEELASAYGASPDQIRAVMPRAFRVVDRRLDPAVRLKLCLDYEAGGKNAGGAPRRAVDWDQVAEELCIPLTADEPADELPEPGPEQGAGAEPDAEPDDDLDSRLPSESEDED